MKENSWLKDIFLIHAHISYQSIKTRVWQYITNQNSCDVTAVLHTLILTQLLTNESARTILIIL